MSAQLARSLRASSRWAGVGVLAVVGVEAAVHLVEFSGDAVLFSFEDGQRDGVGVVVDVGLAHLSDGCVVFGEFGDGLRHAVHLEAAQHDDEGSAGRIMTHGAPPWPGAGRHSVRHWPSVR